MVLEAIRMSWQFKIKKKIEWNFIVHSLKNGFFSEQYNINTIKCNMHQKLQYLYPENRGWQIIFLKI